jgi:glycerol-3-phosphate acyltransferase PlsY
LILVALVAAFLLGTIPTGLLVVRALTGQDLRAKGSGNIGATNVVRAVGWGWGIATLLVDALKGAAVPLVLAHLDTANLIAWQIAAAALALAGNVFNPFLRFKGGKGVGTALGLTFAIAPQAASFGLVAFFIGFLATRIVSVGSLSAGLVFAVAAIVQYFRNAPHPPALWLGFCLVVSALVFVTHRANLRRLANGTETRLTRQK